MDKDDMMPVEMSQETLWTLLADRRSIRLALPPLPMAGMAEPIRAFMDFDAEAVDAMLDRLTILRSRLMPQLPKPGKRN